MLAFTALFTVQLADAQQSNGTDQKGVIPTLNVASRLVLVDVVVTDKAGNPVTDLTKDDFAVYEDKVSQRVVSFESPSAHTLPVGSNNARLNLEDPKSFGQSPVTIHLYVTDTDAIFNQAVEAGATVTMPPADMFWGDRYGKLVDPFGHHWSIATHVEDPTPEQMQERMAALFSAAPCDAQ